MFEVWLRLRMMTFNLDSRKVFATFQKPLQHIYKDMRFQTPSKSRKSSKQTAKAKKKKTKSLSSFIQIPAVGNSRVID